MSGEVWQARGTERKDSMARVFRGKVAIPGEQMDVYLEALGQFERDKAPLRTQLEQYAGDFAHTLAQQYAPKTVRKHTAIITLFIEFVCRQTDVQRLEEITRGMANSAFRQWYQRKVGDRTESELKTAVRKFFQFLAQEKGVRNEAVLKRLQ
jgi:site-specific recombinase XerC